MPVETTSLARRDEPYRRALSGHHADGCKPRGCGSSGGDRTGRSLGYEPYATPQALRTDLVAIAHSLTRDGARLLASGGALGRLIRTVESCGFHLATLDLRQNSDVHCARGRRAAARRPVSRRTMPHSTRAPRVALLRRELASPRLLASPYAQYGAETLSELAIVRAAATAHALYGSACITTYIISKCESVSDMLEVNLLLKEAGPVPARGARRGGHHGGAAVRDHRRPGARAADHARMAGAARGACGGGAPRLPGSDGRLLGLEQGRRLPHLGVEPEPGDARAGRRVRRGRRSRCRSSMAAVVRWGVAVVRRSRRSARSLPAPCRDGCASPNRAR